MKKGLSWCRGQQWALISIAAFIALGSGCTGKQKSGQDELRAKLAAQYQWPQDKTKEAAFETWAGGDEEGAVQVSNQSNVQESSVEALFFHAEVDYWSGDVERSFDRHLELIARMPESPLTWLSAARINDLADDVIDFDSRLTQSLGQLKFHQVHPLTAAYLSMAGQTAAYNNWNRTRSAQPFETQQIGLPLRWMYSPLLSMFRLSDFDTPMKPEQEQALSSAYISPLTAEDVSINLKQSYPSISSNTTIAPDLGSSGIYYLETFATVTADAPQVYWLYGNFASAARVWVDGEVVLERQEGDYSPGQRWRRIKLSPGTHRVLVKLAHEENYRDWFDLSFLNRDGSILGGSALTFSEVPPSTDYKASKDGVEVLSALYTQDQLDPFLLHKDDVSNASGTELYLAASAALYDRQNTSFELAYNELLARYPNFAALHGLKSRQVKTLWEVPSTMRESTSIQSLRKAYKEDPTSVMFSMELGNWLKKKETSKEVKTLLKYGHDAAVVESKDGQRRLRNVRALNAWGSYLEGEGWDELAEAAYKDAIAVAPSNCGAAIALQSLMYAREAVVEPAKITPSHEQCPTLHETWVKKRGKLAEDEAFALTERSASRYPYSSNSQIAYARELVARGKKEKATQVLMDTFERMPWSTNLLEERIDMALAQEGEEAALKLLDTYKDEYTNSSWIVWKRADITSELPLMDLLEDAKKVAVEIAKKEPVGGEGTAVNSVGDEAFYAIDFAANKYFKDGSSIQLTHTLKRVMTKNAIDAYGEVSIPKGARLIHARTIKQDGSVQTPKRVSGKSTLSMPGLAPGDFVELAYLTYESSFLKSRTHREGTRFYFKMTGISSMRSEYVVINPSGEFLRINDAPNMESFSYQGQNAVRFLKTNSPRPRDEPRTLPQDEFLPWIQNVNEGTIQPSPESSRLFVRETLLDHIRLSDESEHILKDLTKSVQAESEDERVKQIFYKVTDYFVDSSTSLKKELAHSVLEKEGNPMLALKAIYDRLGIENQVYLIRSKYASPVFHPMFEFQQYSHAALRVVMPDSGKVVWLTSFAKDAMFDQMSPAFTGEPAVCVSCEEAAFDTVPTEGFSERKVTHRLDTTLDANGTLKGKAVFTMNGDFAMTLRDLFRKRQETRQRDLIMDSIMNAVIPGSVVKQYDIRALADRDVPVEIVIDFEREQFARRDASGKALLIEVALFRSGVEQAYATLPDRVTPMMVGNPVNSDQELVIKLPSGMKAQVRSQSGEWTHDSEFGTLNRKTVLDGDTLTLGSRLSLDIQRVQVKQYDAFQKWASDVAKSEVVLVTLK